LEQLEDLVDTLSFSHTSKVTFTHARKDRRATIHIGWLALRLPDTHQRLWVIVVGSPTRRQTRPGQ
jgi:hypothetical protein